MEHTPVPWEAHGTNKGIEIGTQHIGGSHWVICDIAAPQASVAWPNAEFIVRAVNCHEDLVTALSGLFEHCAMVHKHWGENANQKEADAAIQAARDALAKAVLP